MQHEDYTERQARLAAEKAEYSNMMAHLLGPRIQPGDWTERASHEIDGVPRAVAFLMELRGEHSGVVLFTLEFAVPDVASNPNIVRFDTMADARAAYEKLCDEWLTVPRTTGVKVTPGNPQTESSTQ